MVSLELIIQVWLLRNGQVVPPLPLVFLLYFSFTICSVCLYSFSFFFSSSISFLGTTFFNV